MGRHKEPQATKFCKKCDIEKTKENTYFNERTETYNSYCRKCTKEYNLDRRAKRGLPIEKRKHRIKLKENGLRRCSICEKIYPDTEEYFYRYSDGFIKSPCKKCKNKNRANYNKVPEIKTSSFQEILDLANSVQSPEKILKFQIHHPKLLIPRTENNSQGPDRKIG